MRSLYVCTYNSMDSRRNPNGYRRTIVAAMISLGKRFSGRLDLPSAVRNNTKRRIPKIRTDKRLKHFKTLIPSIKSWILYFNVKYSVICRWTGPSLNWSVCVHIKYRWRGLCNAYSYFYSTRRAEEVLGNVLLVDYVQDTGYGRYYHH